MTTLTITQPKTGETETINNVVALWNDDRTVEYIEDGEPCFLHLDDGEVIA